jgi:hypothetical protein
MIILEALNDIKYFLVMIFLCVCMFGNALLILDDKQASLNEEAAETYELLMSKETWYRFADALINQYMLGLGTIDYGNYAGNKALGLIWFYMILATIITQLVFLNILIAIISATYERITERRSTFALMQKTEKLADYIMLVKLSKKMTSSRYLYVVTPIEVIDGDQDLAGAIETLREKLTTMASKNQEKVDANHVKIEATLSVMNQVQDNVKAEIDEVRKGQDNVKAEIDELR